VEGVQQSLAYIALSQHVLTSKLIQIRWMTIGESLSSVQGKTVLRWLHAT
jgi:hypothetical protein